jgi:hypothetical protein
MSKDANKFEIHQNAIRLGSTWIPLDQISFLEENITKVNFFQALFKSGIIAFAVTPLIILLIEKALIFLPNNFILNSANEFIAAAGFDSRGISSITYIIWIVLMDKFHKITREQKIISTSGNSISIFKEKASFISWLKPSNSEKLFRDILIAKDLYLSTIYKNQNDRSFDDN